ncbi:MAG: hypothetical protein NC322_01510 [Alistipes senegalensis]|nr:hypothetical protein [Alistipes senegalensis]
MPHSFRHSFQRLLLRLSASGFRDFATGALNAVGSGGWYWSAAPYAAGSAGSSGFRLQSSNVNPMDNFDRSYGFTVRCVQHLQAAFRRAAPAQEIRSGIKNRAVRKDRAVFDRLSFPRVRFYFRSAATAAAGFRAGVIVKVVVFHFSAARPIFSIRARVSGLWPRKRT